MRQRWADVSLGSAIVSASSLAAAIALISQRDAGPIGIRVLVTLIPVAALAAVIAGFLSRRGGDGSFRGTFGLVIGCIQLVVFGCLVFLVWSLLSMHETL